MSLLLGKKRNKKVVVFLCTGNTCRGPMAQGYMKKAMEERGIERVEVKTAGVMTIPGLIPTPEATQVMKNAGVEIAMHRSSPLTHELIRKADIILGMTPFHVQFALRMSDDAKDKTFLLKEYAESDVKNYQITDPMGMTLEVYKRVYREMKLAIDKMIDTKEIFLNQRVQAKKEEEEKEPTPIKAAVEKKTTPVKKTTKKKAAPAASKPAEAPKKKKTAPKAPAAKSKATDDTKDSKSSTRKTPSKTAVKKKTTTTAAKS